MDGWLGGWVVHRFLNGWHCPLSGGRGESHFSESETERESETLLNHQPPAAFLATRDNP